MNFIRTSVRENHVVKVDVSGLENYEQVLNEIQTKCPNPEFLYKIILTGKKSSELHLSAAKLTSELLVNYFYAKVIADYSEDINIELLKDENSLRGCFVRCMLEKEASAENPELIREAMIYGLQAFDGEVIFNDNP